MVLFFVPLAVGAIGSGAGTSDDTPRWVGVCAGLVFLLGGAALIIGFAVARGAGPDSDLLRGTPWGIRVTQLLAGARDHRGHGRDRVLGRVRPGAEDVQRHDSLRRPRAGQ
jgi:hypothetical protein